MASNITERRNEPSPKEKEKVGEERDLATVIGPFPRKYKDDTQ
jgi:hypothetical protein